MAQKSSGGLNTVAMIVAFLAIGGFLYWLGVASEPAEVAVAEEDVAEEVQPVDFEAFAQNPPMYQNANVRIDDVPVGRVLPGVGFLTEFPDESPYVVSLAPTQAGQVEPGDEVTIVGSVEPIGETMLQGWVEDAIFIDEEEMNAVAAAGSHFLVEELTLDGDGAGMEADTSGGAMDDASATDDAQP